MGLACAHELAAAGATAIVSGRRAEALDAAAAAIHAKGNKADAMALDVTDPQAVARIGQAIVHTYGRVDILVNCAGINIPERHWKDLTNDSWERTVDINLNGAFYAIKAVLPAMRAAGRGTVVNISSWAGVFDLYLTGPAYSASKRGMIAMSNSLNIEEGMHGIRSSVICPAEVATPILRARPTPPTEAEMARMLQPEDIAGAVRFVCELPPRACVNEVIVSPTWNRLYLEPVAPQTGGRS